MFHAFLGRLHWSYGSFVTFPSVRKKFFYLGGDLQGKTESSRGKEHDFIRKCSVYPFLMKISVF